MKFQGKIRFSELLGFSSVAGPIGDGIDFRDATIDARLGAKVGSEVLAQRQPRNPERTSEDPRS